MILRKIKNRALNWTQKLRNALFRFWLRQTGATVSKSVVIMGKAPLISCPGKLAIGDHVIFKGVTLRARVCVESGGSLTIGAGSFINQGVNIAATCGIKLGDRVLTGEMVSIFDSNFHEVDEGAEVVRAPVVIGNNVWIGHAATILPGTSIGDHSVVAAGAVVRGQFPERSLIAGIPGRVVREIRCSADFRRK